MRVPQVSERIKEAPAQALRSVFAGIGQLLLITDKLRHKTLADQDVPRARRPEPAETVTDTPVTSPAGAPEETAAATASPVATAPPEPAAAAPPAVADPEAAAAPKPPKRQSTRNFDKTGNVRLLGDAANGSPLAATATEPVAGAEAAPPLPNYDALTVASLRARLRNLSIAQVRQLAEYERAHAGRADVLGMYERRIAKLEAGAPEAGA